jgi:hypothetical protein
MIKEIRIPVKDLKSFSMDMRLLQDKGFPVDSVTLDFEKSLKYSEFLDLNTDEIVIQWEEEQ